MYTMYTCIGNVFDTSLKSESPPIAGVHKTCLKIIGYLLLSKMSVVYVTEKMEIKECKFHLGPLTSC